MKQLHSFFSALLVAGAVAPLLSRAAEVSQEPPRQPTQAAVAAQAGKTSTDSGGVPGTQWVQANTNGAFPAPPGQAPMSSQQQIQAAFPQTNYTAQNYAVAGQQSYPQQYANNVPQNGVAPMPPLAPPSNFQQAEQVVSPFSDADIIKLRQRLDDSRKAKAYRPVQAIPRISSISVDLSPGAALPIVRLMPGVESTLVFLDSTGAPWPLAVSPRVSDTRYFDAEWLKDSPSVVISPQSAYETGNMTVFLQGQAVPVVLQLSTGEPDSNDKSRTVDYRLDLRVPGRGPNAHASILGPDKISLYDGTMQAFLDGLPPADAKRVKVHGSAPARAEIWQYGGEMFVRTSYDIQTAFDRSMSAADGTRVYRLPPTPYVTLSEMGQSVTLQLDIN